MKMKISSSLSKITRPSVSGIFQRERLFHLLDNGCKQPAVWVSGPAGSGKTTLVASYLEARGLPCLWYQMDQGDADIATFFYYMGLAAEKASPRSRKPLPLLTPEYLQGIPIFTKRYFENLCDMLTPPFVLVFDNYQDMPAGSAFHDMIIYGLDTIPEGISVIVASRQEPPSQFARLRANSKIDFIGWEELRFTLDESREVARMYGQGNPADETLVELYRKTEGWVAGLILIMRGAKTSSIDPEFFTRLVPEAIFDYFASEIFEKTDSVTREFLLKTALLPEMTSQTAEKLTHISAAGKILSQLYKNHYFTHMHSPGKAVYHYHPLFREFLLSKAKVSFTRDDISLIQRNAAALLEEAGQIEQAALILRDALDWAGFIRLTLAHAQSLVAQGRSKTLEEWIGSVPEAMLGSSPYLFYWMGVCKMFSNLHESRSYLERAFNAFKDWKDPAGLYLSWSGIIDTFVYEWGDFAPLDRWISEIETLLPHYPFPSQEIEARVAYGIFCALMYRQPQHPDLPLWESRVKEIVTHSANIRLQTTISSQLILYYTWWAGDLSKAAFLVRILKPASRSREVDPLSFIVWRSIEAAYSWMVASREDCLAAVNEGLKTSADTGIHIWDFMLCAIGAMCNTTADDHEGARKYLDRMLSVTNSAAFMSAAFYHYLSAIEAFCIGDRAVALEHARSAFQIGSKSGAPYAVAIVSFVIGAISLGKGERETGMAHLATARRIGSSINSKVPVYLSLISEARYFLERKEDAPGIHALSQAMVMGKEQGFLNHSVWQPSVMAFLCAKALEAGIEADYVRELIKKRDLKPPMPPFEKGGTGGICIDNWPWPLKIHTLGKFGIIKDGMPLAFSGKAQQKPLSLLKAIIALGGRDVSKEQLMESLWPDADGSQAHQSFEIALHRLRRLMGSDKAVLLHEGLVTLDARRCRVDVFALEHSIGQAEDMFQNKPKGDAVKRIIHLADRIFSLYKGHFLEQDEGHAWAVTLRERMRAKFLHFISRCGQYLEKAGQKEKTIEYLEKGLERDSLHEEFYQQLMACYHRLGRPAAAIEVYRRCRAVLSAALGIEPSQATEEIYSRISRKQQHQE